MRVILASASPRRKELLGKLFRKFEVIPAEGAETCTKELPEEAVQELALRKAEEVEQSVCREDSGAAQDYLIIASDTVVCYQGRILGKPAGEADARAVLRMLAGNVHQVYTGVALICQKSGERQCMTFAECTDVTFYPMTEEEIKVYVQTKEPMDKAGSYGIQGMGGRFVKKIDGDYNNVVGLPVAKIYQVIKTASCLSDAFPL